MVYSVLEKIFVTCFTEHQSCNQTAEKLTLVNKAEELVVWTVKHIKRFKKKKIPENSCHSTFTLYYVSPDIFNVHKYTYISFTLKFGSTLKGKNLLKRVNHSLEVRVGGGVGGVQR